MQFWPSFNFTRISRKWWQDPVFLLALGLAVICHAILLSIHFVVNHSPEASVKDVTVAVHLTPEKIEKADLLAQANQKGDGELKQVHAQTTPIPLNAPDSSMGEEEQQMLEQLAQKQQLSFEERMLMTTLSWQKQQQQQQRKKQQDEIQSQRQARAAMIASIEAQYAQRQQIYSKQQRIKTVTGISAKQDASAAYLDRFRQKVEMFGNRYYPDAARQQDLSGEVRLMVIINSQGGLRALHLLDSSGNPILDEAAKASVRKAMPFGAFDAGMKGISELRIVRTWRFDAQNSVFSVH
ncbi:energy transducer TonB [Acinetobacter qingfengensis]|uniref:Energy transducer TonB n=2 Tax=Acinetobacter qingfengensis TaxID=1262585 RepID=A0A1E7R9Y4_9GAMM|nr:energy transducer TonB [Acinetobacter qingfengensis]OEY96150.1 energy transducer TonB [Acinetobacter qingfengensis]